MLGISNFTSMTLHIPNVDLEHVRYMQDVCCKAVFLGTLRTIRMVALKLKHLAVYADDGYIFLQNCFVQLFPWIVNVCVCRGRVERSGTGPQDHQ